MADDQWRSDDDDSPRRGGYREPHRGVMLLVFGVLSLTVCAIFGPFAWKMSNDDLKKIERGVMDPEGRGLTMAGKITGIIGTIYLILSILFICLYVGIIMLAVGGAAAGR